jgi:hypothetical protein
VQGPVAEAPKRTAEQLLEAQRQALRPREIREGCRAAVGNEIVVCAENPDDHRVASSTDDAISNGEAVFDGLPRAPDLTNPELGKGITVARGCFIPPCPPPPVYYIDLKAIPEAPPGSDAARYAEE